jgi:hypothetical protein
MKRWEAKGFQLSADENEIAFPIHSVHTGPAAGVKEPRNDDFPGNTTNVCLITES